MIVTLIFLYMKMTKITNKIPDNEPTFTPFNAKKESSDSKKKRGVDEAFTMADTIAGMSQKNARMWQIIALVSLSSFFISLGILIYAVNLPKTIPVIVTVAVPFPTQLNTSLPSTSSNLATLSLLET